MKAIERLGTNSKTAHLNSARTTVCLATTEYKIWSGIACTDYVE